MVLFTFEIQTQVDQKVHPIVQMNDQKIKKRPLVVDTKIRFHLFHQKPLKRGATNFSSVICPEKRLK
jgi:hypothetical protein